MPATLASPLARKPFPASPTFAQMRPWDHGAVPRSVLVVDDDDCFRDLVARLLSGWGHSVIAEATTVHEALERAVELRPDAALVDIGLPDGDGFELTRQLRAMSWPVRVVLISSAADGANVPAARRAGACAFLPKEELSGLELRRLLDEG